jgi:hypothetical protein
MEVHAHSHTERKKWTHYLWEFLMLFLAVFCGFLAEFQLEHVLEHAKEREYIRSMVEDLAQDTAEVNKANYRILEVDTNLDSLLSLLELPISKDKNDLKNLYVLHYYNFGAEGALFSQRTISQLKNAGGLRLIRHKNVADSITLYDTRLQHLAGIFKSYDEVTTDMIKEGYMIFDNQYIRHHFENGSISLLTYDPKTIRHYANCVFMVQIVEGYYSDYLNQQKKLAIDLMSVIKKEYHLK